MNIELKELNNDNWLETANLSVSEKQKEIFPIPNVYWIGVSRYEEHTTLYAIMLGETVIGLLGLGYDEDGVSGFINPIMIDEKYQGNHYAENAMTIAIDILKIEEIGKWIRLDARGNMSSVHAEFNITKEILAFPIRAELGECDYLDNHPDLDSRLVAILKGSEKVLNIHADILF